MVALIWLGFILFVLVVLGLDLGVLNRKAHVVRAREALAFTGFTIVLAMAFMVGVYFMYEHDWLGLASAAPDVRGERPDGLTAATQFVTGWLIEYSLSMDNIFVMAVIFQYFRVPPQYQHRVLFWGVLGALVMRGVMIGVGAALIHRFDWIMYVFGAFLIFTAYRMLVAKDEHPEPDKNPAVRLARKLYPVSPAFEGQRFFTTLADGRRAMTPLFLVLLVVETTDVIFAVDSIPAIFGITSDPFLVFTSNVFALLGLRSLYFALAAIIDKFRFLKPSLIAVLAFVGAKMMLLDVVHIHPLVSLAIIIGILGTGVAASIYESMRKSRTPEEAGPAPAAAAEPEGAEHGEAGEAVERGER